MKLKHLLHKTIPPCAECPYKLGLVRTLRNPCPQCRNDGYRMLEMFRQQAPASGGKK